MKFFLAGSVALAAALAAVPASAQTFEGPYAGVQGGWNQDKVGSPDSDVGALQIHRSRDSFTGGIFAGYDHQVVPRVVIGGEIGANFTAGDTLTRRSGADLARIDPSISFDAGARAGYLLTPTTLVYVRGGYEILDARVTRITDGAIHSQHDNFDGWSVGGGVERMLTDHISARIEYRYSDLGNDGGKYQRQRTLLGVAYRF